MTKTNLLTWSRSFAKPRLSIAHSYLQLHRSVVRFYSVFCTCTQILHRCMSVKESNLNVLNVYGESNVLKGDSIGCRSIVHKILLWWYTICFLCVCWHTKYAVCAIEKEREWQEKPDLIHTQNSNWLTSRRSNKKLINVWRWVELNFGFCQCSWHSVKTTRIHQNWIQILILQSICQTLQKTCGWEQFDCGQDSIVNGVINVWNNTTHCTDKWVKHFSKQLVRFGIPLLKTTTKYMLLWMIGQIRSKRLF